MKNRRLFAVIPAVLLAFSLLVVSCNNGGGSIPPFAGQQQVLPPDMSMPNARSLASFAGSFVNNQDEIIELLGDALDVIMSLDLTGIDLDGIVDGLGLDFSYRINPSYHSARAAGSVNEIINEDLFDDGRVIARAYVKTDYAFPDDYENIKKGDYAFLSGETELSVDFYNFKEDSITINGKATFDGDVSAEVTVKELDIDRERFEGNVSAGLNFSNKYALSISDGSKGMKVIMNVSFSISSISLYINSNDFIGSDGYLNDDYLMDRIEQELKNVLNSITLDVNIDIYDNSNSLRYSYDLDSLVMETTGMSLNDLLEELMEELFSFDYDDEDLL